MKVYIFRCRARTKLYAATRFETGSNLPADQCSGGWEFYKRMELAQRGNLPFDVDAATLRRHVQRNGLYVWDESRSILSRRIDNPLPPPREQDLPLLIASEIEEEEMLPLPPQQPPPPAQPMFSPSSRVMDGV